MKKIPFVANSSDNMHCCPAVFRMLSKYYFDEDLNWREIDRIMKSVSRKGTWTFPGLTYLAKKGLKITSVEPVNYQKLYKYGPDYLRKVVGKDTANYYLYKSNIQSVIPFIPEFLENVKHEIRKGSIEEIIRNLKEGFLVSVEVNSRILNNKPGFSLHYILLYDCDGENIVFHDPGLPPIKARKITLKDFEKAFNFPGSNGGITIFRK
ncbi:MAG: hypothetical protein US96_C0034G0017 [Candidatus Woesebacteria bacterium GW2011_GWB1_38_5b]|uniref:Peptidase C39-like domain-containing protein n=1 Tax=Candidatus Woesebacteria bacterium GW2011_GWB1_38_5b TaxID=1618569 RepID=A0A0G0NB67_9BACT|nr:MAG: hypothetical protein US96_C0034G0017 [Candidatus Woesebacteria bacterium GW2011_GWB1_38_5b]OGH47922.1 MAG: hypothetical protein A3A51_00280 [Candidatus Levybacteria bacterium RIFCSPLOWO2_01_FULL_39_10]